MRILFVHMNELSFQETDLRLLRERNEVTAIRFKWHPSCVWEVLTALRRCDVVFVWFASHHSFIPCVLGRALGKKVLVAASDYDLANENWDTFDKGRAMVRRPLVNCIMRCANVVIVPSRFSLSLAMENTVLGRMPEKIHVVPHGFEPPAALNIPRERIITTVGALIPSNWIRKGHREFLELAALLPDIQCFLVGKPSSEKYIREVRSASPRNVAVTGFLPNQRLTELLARTSVYVQLSVREGFGCSVAEAMLSGCVPVVTPVASLPEVVGDCGYYADYRDIEGAHHAIVAAMSDRRTGARARQRIVEKFSLERRRTSLNCILNSL